MFVVRVPGAVRDEGEGLRSAEGGGCAPGAGGVAVDGDAGAGEDLRLASGRAGARRVARVGAGVADRPSPGPSRKREGKDKQAGLRDGERRRVGLMARYRVRHDGWTEARQRLFLRALAETGCVRDACARARISSTSAYRIRKTNPSFARAWTRALGKAATTIEQAAYERAVIGWDEPIVSGGKIIGQRRRHSDALLRMLWLAGAKGLSAGAAGGAAPEGATQEALVAAAERACAAAGGVFMTAATAAETDAVLKRNLDALALRLRREGRG